MPDTDVPHSDSTTSTLCGFMDNPIHCHGIPYNTSSKKRGTKYVKGMCPRSSLALPCTSSLEVVEDPLQGAGRQNPAN